MFICDFVESISSRSTNRILQMIDELVMSGKDLAQFVSDLVYYYRNLLVCSIAGNPGEVIDAPADILEKMKQQAGTMARDTIISFIKELSSLEANMKWAGHPRILLEVAVIKLCEGIFATGNDNIGDRLSALERKLENVRSVPIQSEVVKAAQEIPAHSAAAEPKPHDMEVREAETPKIAAKPCNYLALWDEVADELKKTDRMALFSNLSDTKAVELDGKHIAIVFGNNRGFNKMYVSRLENIETIQKILQKKLGHEVRIKCIDEEDLSENNTTPLSQDRDEFTEKAVSLAKKLNVPYDVIDK
jgi:DNA polymerase-3 subunit gamma/tau